MMPFLMVEVTRLPKATAPTNSVHMDNRPTWSIVRVRAATEEAYELATSLAPLPNELQQKAMEMIARIQPYLLSCAILSSKQEKGGARRQEVVECEYPLNEDVEGL